jgi:glutaredoxin-like protein NrdH
MVIEKAPVIRVYSKPRCVQCTAVKRRLDQAGATYDVVDVSLPENAGDFAAIQALDYKQVPVTFVNDDHFGGYNPDALDDAIARQRRAAMHIVEVVA